MSKKMESKNINHCIQYIVEEDRKINNAEFLFGGWK